MNDVVANKAVDGITTSPPSASDKKPEAPKAIVSFTSNAKKRGKTNPVFSVGELLAWKGVWFRVEGVGNEGILLKPKLESR